MDYYKLKRQALSEIKQLAGVNTPYDDIVFFIYEKFGFTERFVRNYYDELLARGFVGNVELVKKPKKVKK